MAQIKSSKLISENKLFKDIKLSDLKLSVKQSNFLELNEGNVIFQNEDTDDSIYLVVEGEIKIKFPHSLGNSIIERNGKNDFFGEKEFLAKIPRASSAVANTNCMLYKMTRKELVRLASKYKKISNNLLARQGRIDSEEVIKIEGFPTDDSNKIDELTVEKNIDTEHENEDANKEIQNEEMVNDSDKILETSNEEMLENIDLEPGEAINDLTETIAIPAEDNLNVNETEINIEEENEYIEQTKGYDENVESLTEEIKDNLDLDNDDDIKIEEGENPDDLNNIIEIDNEEITNNDKNIDEDIEQVEKTIEHEETYNEEPKVSSEQETVAKQMDIEEDNKQIENNEQVYEVIEEEGEKTDTTAHTEDLEIGNEQANEPENLPEPDETKIKNFEYQVNTEAEEINYEALVNERLLRDLLYLYRNKELAGIITTTQELIKNFTGAHCTKIFMVDIQKEELDLLKVENNNVIHKINYLKTGIAGCSASNDEIIFLENPAEDERFNANVDSFENEEINNILYFPLHNNIDEVTGLFYLSYETSEHMEEKDKIYLETISKHVLNVIKLVEKNDIIEKDETVEKETGTGIVDKLANFVLEDINTPLLIVKQYADFIKKKGISKDINLVTSYMMKHIESVVNFSSTVSDFINGDIVLNIERIKVSTLLDEILRMLADYVEARQVILFKLYEADAFVDADSLKLYQAFYQLTKFSCSNMDENGKIYLVTNLKEDNNIEISYRNTGWTAENLTNEIFDFSLDNENVNLELAIAAKIIHDHKGSIEVKTEKEKENEFIITIPVASTIENN